MVSWCKWYNVQRHTWSESCCKQTVPIGPWWHTCPDYFHECCSGGHRCSHNASILTSVCITRPSRTWSTGVGMLHRSHFKAAAHPWYILPNMFSNPSICPSSFPQAYNENPFKWLKLFNMSTYSSAGRGCTLEWMLQRQKQRLQRQTSWAPYDRCWPWQKKNHQHYNPSVCTYYTLVPMNTGGRCIFSGSVLLRTFVFHCKTPMCVT